MLKYEISMQVFINVECENRDEGIKKALKLVPKGAKINAIFVYKKENKELTEDSNTSVP